MDSQEEEAPQEEEVQVEDGNIKNGLLLKADHFYMPFIIRFCMP